MLQVIILFVRTYQLPLLCVLGDIGVGVYIYGSHKLYKLHAKQVEEMHLHPDEPVPALPEKLKQTALAFQIAGFTIMLAVCLGMFLLGHFDTYLAMLGIG